MFDKWDVERIPCCIICQEPLIELKKSLTDRTTTRNNVFNHAKNDIQNIVSALDAILNGYKKGEFVLFPKK